MSRDDATDRNKEQHLRPQQLAAVGLLAAGQPDATVSERVGVDRATVWRWRTQDAAFRAELNSRREEAWSASLDRIRALVPPALDAIEAELSHGNRLRAAEAVLRVAGLSRADLSRIGPSDAALVADRDQRHRFEQELGLH